MSGKDNGGNKFMREKYETIALTDLREIANVMENDLESFINGATLQQDIAMLFLRYFGV